MRFHILLLGCSFTAISPFSTKSDSTVLRSRAALEEKAYIKRFGNNPFEYNSWKAMKKRYHDIEPTLMRLCEKAHQEAGYGEAAKVDTVTLNQWTLLFDNEDFRSRKVDVITYTTEDTENRWYITEGVRKDCVHYLRLMSPQRREFKLEKQVCRLYKDFETVPKKTHFRVDS